MFGDQARVAAANAIWWIDRSHPLVEPTFRSILTNDSVPQPWMDGRAAAARALQFMGPQIADWAVEPLLQLLKHEDQEMRKSAFEALCWIGGSSAQAVEAVVRLPERKEDDDIVPAYNFEQGMLMLFHTAGGPGAEALAAAINDGEPELVQRLMLIYRNASPDSDPLVMEAMRAVSMPAP